jgi:hypothetical protein
MKIDATKPHDQLSELYYQLEQINRTIAALEHFEVLKARRQLRLRTLPAGLVRDALTTRRVTAQAS